MISVAIFALTLASQSPPGDPNLLPIGRSGSIEVNPGDLVDLRTGKVVRTFQIAKAAVGKPYLFIGEQHATTSHQLEEAAIVSSIAESGRRVTVGVEMFQRPMQDVLDQWTQGKLSESEFIESSDWKHQWGFDYDFYRPLFEVVRTNHLGLIGLNLPRDWVHNVATGGYSALPTSARLQLPPELFLDNKSHRELFSSLMGGHGTGGGMENMYAAQVLWDSGMADTAIKFREIEAPDPKNLFVVIAGSGHVMYGQGINYRIRQRHAGDGITVVMLTADKPISVSKGIGDFVFVSKSPDKQ